ncbi:PaaI family thioesterase [Thetidibacter halocola]|uniref:PaaI family thioesterase n=1 Tax=Thetidibacter halocola TaxID=2827239 RepID=A0A8J7WD78_9RHOB|nr:PaaI family thioesterase [Thetidibacter halocola]MBS0125435.1 PaaI family thioesterase [Thetidibacter halocola]
MTPDAAQAWLEKNFAPWVLALSPRVTGIGPGGAVLEIPVTDAVARVGGIVCGQALATLADTAMVLACAGELGEFVPVATTNLETRFLTAARGQAVRCEARVIRAGRALIFAEARLSSLPEDKPVAAASATFFRP